MKKRVKRNRHIGNINVTPIVDVMLVLLIIFMLTSPMIMNHIDINLPQANTNPLETTEKELLLTIDKHGNLFLHETPFDKELLLKKLTQITNQNPNLRILIRGDKETQYSHIIEIMSILHTAKATNISLLSNPKQK